MNTSTSHWYFSGFDARKACSWSPEEGLEEGEKYDFGRQPASTELSSKKTFCGGNVKLRALKLDRRNYSWGSEVVTRKTHVLEVFYNASYNKLDSSGCCTFQAVISSTLWSHNWSKEED